MAVFVSGESTTTVNSETSMEVSESETTGVAKSEIIIVTSGTEATTVVSSTEITTVATTTDGSLTLADATTTTTTADAGPTNLLINGNFDLGSASRWGTTRAPSGRLAYDDPFEGPAYAQLDFSIEDGAAYNNYLYQTIDKSLLKAGSYELSAMLHVALATDNIYGDGCNSMGLAVTMGIPACSIVSKVPL
jgi:hypothetical protein